MRSLSWFALAALLSCGGGGVPPATASGPAPSASSTPIPGPQTVASSSSKSTSSSDSPATVPPIASATASVPSADEVHLGPGESSTIPAELGSCRWISVVKNGQTIGLRVMGVKPTMTIAKRGILQNGDTIQNVNGTDLDSAANAAKVVDELLRSPPNPEHITVRLVRAGTTVTTSYRVDW